MKNLCALIPLLVALPVIGSCAGTKPVQSVAGEGGSGATGTGTGGATGSGGSQTTGSGGVNTTGSGGSGGGGGDVGPTTDAGDPNCGLYQFEPTPKAADILLVLDRSASMKDPINDTSTAPSKWSVVVPTLSSVVNSTDTSVLWGMKSFPEGSGSACVAGSVTSNIDVKVAATNATAVTAAITATTDEGNGTPTGDAINAAVTYLSMLTDTNPKYILLATDGEPSCGAIPSTDNARPYAVSAVMNAKTAGFPTFVIGIGTTSSDTTTLNQLGDAGGEVPAGASNPLAPHFYLASDMTTLTSALSAITGQISTCLFPLASPPPVRNDGTKVGVYVGANMTRIKYDATMTDGWAYTDVNDTAIQVFGNSCAMIQAAGAGAVQIIFGCANILPPG